MNQENDLEQAKQLLEAQGYSVTKVRHPGISAILVGVDHHRIPLGLACCLGGETLEGKTFNLAILDEIPQVYLPQMLPPKNKPWYQRFDKHVGKHRK